MLALVGERVEVHVFDASESPHLVARFGGVLEAGHSITGGEPGEGEAIFLRLAAGEERASLSLDRELYGGAMIQPDGSISLRLGSVELAVGRVTQPL